MSPYDEVYSRLERIKQLWIQLQGTPPHSSKYEVLVGEIRAESLAYLALVDPQKQKKTGIDK
jgi:hypothetical protein